MSDMVIVQKTLEPVAYGNFSISKPLFRAVNGVLETRASENEVPEATVDEQGIRLEFAQFGHFDSFDVIRSMVSMASVADVDLPAPIATGLKTMYYVDADVIEGVTYYYKVRVWRGSTALISDQVSVMATLADPYFANVTFLAHLNELPFTDVKGSTALSGSGTYSLDPEPSPVSANSLRLFPGQLFTPTGNYFNFNGTTGKVTVEFYFKPNAAQSGNGVMLNIEGGSRWSFMTTGGTKPTAWVYDGNDVFIQVPNKLTAGVWHHFAFTKNGAQCRLFIDGLKVAEVSNTISGYSSCVVGMGNNGSTEPFNGNLSDVRITVGEVRYMENFLPHNSPHLHG